jgi:hypothetical protein
VVLLIFNDYISLVNQESANLRRNFHVFQKNG